MHRLTELLQAERATRRLLSTGLGAPAAPKVPVLCFDEVHYFGASEQAELVRLLRFAMFLVDASWTPPLVDLPQISPVDLPLISPCGRCGSSASPCS